MGEYVVVAAADGDLVGVEVAVDVDGVGVDPDSFLAGDGAGVEYGACAEEEVLAVGAVAFVLEGHAYCQVYHVGSLEVEVGFDFVVCGVGGAFQVARGVGVESVYVFAESRVWDAIVAECDAPVECAVLLEAAAVAEGSGFDWRVLAGHAEYVGHHAGSAFVELLCGEFAGPGGVGFDVVAHRLFRPYGWAVMVMNWVLPVVMSSPRLACSIW